MPYKKVIASAVTSHALDQYKTACERCGRGLKGKGARGDKEGNILCRDCSTDKTWKALAAGRLRFDDLQHEEEVA